jgi:hypothetical protein
LVGAAFPPLFLIGRFGLAAYLAGPSSILPVSVVLGCVGGLGTTGLVALAQREGRSELAPSAAPESERPSRPGSSAEHP